MKRIFRLIVVLFFVFACESDKKQYTKLDSKKTINHYSDIIENEINSEIKAEGKKIYVLTPK